MKYRPAAILATFAPACVTAIDSDLNFDAIRSPDAKLVIMAIGDPRTRDGARIWAFDPEKIAIPIFADAPGSSIEVIVYPFTAEELQVELDRPLDSASENTIGSRALPIAPSSRAVLANGPLVWEAAPRGTALDAFRLAPFDPEACAAQGCIEAVVDPQVCKIPCRTAGDPPDPILPRAPDPVRPVMLEPCPPGWTRADPEREGAPAWCNYPRPPAPVSCAEHEAQFARAEGCTAIGTSCDPSGWPILPADPPPIYVRPSASSGGDGSAGAPYRTIAEALLEADLARPIALAAESFAGEPAIHRPAKLFGACAESTVFELGPSGFVVAAPGVELHDVTLHSARDASGVVIRGEATTLLLDSVAITGDGCGLGVDAVGGSITLRDSIIRGFDDAGLRATSTVAVELGHVVITGSGQFGALIEQGSSAILRDVAIREIHDSIGERTTALAVALRASVDARGLTIERSAHTGIFIASAGATLSDTFIVDMQQSTLTPDSGIAVAASGPADVRFEQSAIDEAAYVAFVADASTTATIADSLISGTKRAPSGLGGIAVLAYNEAKVRFERTMVRDSATYAVQAALATVEAEDLAIVGIRSGSCGPELPDLCNGIGFAAASTDVKLERAYVGGGNTYGISVDGPTELTDVVIRDIGPQLLDLSQGMGLIVARPTATVTISRMRVEHIASRAIHVVEDATLVASDVDIVEAGIADPAAASGQSALSINGTAELYAVRANGLGFCLWAYGMKARIHAEDLECAGFLRFSPEQNAIGISSQARSTVTVQRAVLSDIDGTGLVAKEAGSVDASDLAIRRTTRGGIFAHGAFTTFVNTKIEDVEGYSVYARLEGLVTPKLELQRVTVSGMKLGLMPDGSMAGGAVRSGVAGAVRMHDFVIRDAPTEIGRIDPSGALFFDRGRVENVAGPLRVEDPEFDRRNVMIEVTYGEGTARPIFVH